MPCECLLGGATLLKRSLDGFRSVQKNSVLFMQEPNSREREMRSVTAAATDLEAYFAENARKIYHGALARIKGDQ